MIDKFAFGDFEKELLKKDDVKIAFYLNNKQIFGLVSKDKPKDEYDFRTRFDDTRGILYNIEDRKNRPLPSWAIIKASMSGHTEYGWVRNDGESEPIAPKNVFKKRAEAAANKLADDNWREHVGGEVVKIYTDKDKFIKDYKKLTGKSPKL